MFVLTEDQQLIHEAARTLLVENCSTEQLRKMLADGQVQDEARWAQILEMGLPSILVSEERGGLGLSAVDFVGVAEAAGYVALPEPLVEQGGVVLPLLAGLSDSKGWLDRALAGAKIAIDHPAQHFVADANQAEAVIFFVDGAIHIVERDQLELIKQESIDPFRELSRVVYSFSAETQLAKGDEAQKLIAEAFERGALFCAAQALGLAQRCVDMAVSYTQERTQFGKPIGSYQAVKHMLANVQVQIEFARPVIYAAAVELPLGGPIAAARVSHAKLAATEAADFAARTALQAHGAMGFTWEVDLHFFMKRALALLAAWGKPALHRNRVVERMLEQPIGPDSLFASEIEAIA
ncbi:acyl-CoA dehydrogenase family protein [Zhongshania sp.]|uniref:acyl-CoA dehydrogenase family protein n=1 Tax=Zhongshania sp. TaxID=1971902 RepID=UPI0035694B58